MATILVTAAQDYVGTSCIDAALADTNVKQVIWLPYTPFSFPNKLASCNPKLSIVNMPDEASWTSWPASLGSHFKDVTGVVWAVTPPGEVQHQGDNWRARIVEYPKAAMRAVNSARASKLPAAEPITFVWLGMAKERPEAQSKDFVTLSRQAQVCREAGDALAQQAKDLSAQADGGTGLAVRMSSITMSISEATPPTGLRHYASLVGLWQPFMKRCAPELIYMAYESYKPKPSKEAAVVA